MRSISARTSGCTAGEEALAFECEERCSRRQHHADPQRGDTVEAWHLEYFGKRDADQGDHQTDQRGTVLEQDREHGRVLAAPHSLQPAEPTALMTEFAKRDEP